MLYAPEQHEPLSDVPWNAARARAAIHAIVADADQAYDPKAFWLANDWDGYQAVLPMKNVYCGAGGVGWALDRLRAPSSSGTPGRWRAKKRAPAFVTVRPETDTRS